MALGKKYKGHSDFVKAVVYVRISGKNVSLHHYFQLLCLTE